MHESQWSRGTSEPGAQMQWPAAQGASGLPPLHGHGHSRTFGTLPGTGNGFAVDAGLPRAESTPTPGYMAHSWGGAPSSGTGTPGSTGGQGYRHVSDNSGVAPPPPPPPPMVAVAGLGAYVAGQPSPGVAGGWGAAAGAAQVPGWGGRASAPTVSPESSGAVPWGTTSTASAPLGGSSTGRGALISSYHSGPAGYSMRASSSSSVPAGQFWVPGGTPQLSGSGILPPPPPPPGSTPLVSPRTSNPGMADFQQQQQGQSEGGQQVEERVTMLVPENPRQGPGGLWQRRAVLTTRSVPQMDPRGQPPTGGSARDSMV